MTVFTFSPKRAGLMGGGGPHQRMGLGRGTRVATRLLAGVLAAALVLPLAEGTQDAAAGKKVKTVTKTFSSNGLIDVPDAGSEGASEPYPATIDVDAFGKYKKARITDVNLTLRGLDHTYPDNVDVMLALGNRRATVMSDVGFNIDIDGLHLTLDDQAGVDLPDDGPLASGTFRPTNEQGTGEGSPADDPFAAPAPSPNGNTALTTFNGAKPDGEWRLFIHDDYTNDDGELANGWKLEITAKVKDKKKNKDKD